MKFYKYLYIGNTVKKPKKAIKKLKRHKLQPGLYVIAFDAQTARLSIYPGLMLTQWYYKENPPACIVGLAGSQDEAFGVIERIAKEAFAATGEVSLVSFLSGRDPESFEG